VFFEGAATAGSGVGLTVVLLLVKRLSDFSVVRVLGLCFGEDSRLEFSKFSHEGSSFVSAEGRSRW
jgi:hypothetical protein